MKFLLFSSAFSHTPASRQRSCASRRGGFTLIEILIVISITALISALTLGGITQIGTSNKRTTCQTNLSQIYQASRLYQADEGAFPYYKPEAATVAERGIGLWALYAFHDFSKTNGLKDVDAAPVERYTRRVKVLHCPQDTGAGRTNLYVDASAAIKTFNVNYVSYQATTADVDGFYPYQSVRTTTMSDAGWKRQLLPKNGTVLIARPPADDTVVTWCPWHRTVLGGREYDNVLFYDGSVQLIPRIQTDPNGTTTQFTGWMRIPRKVL